MQTVAIPVPEEVLGLLKHSKLADRSPEDQVRIALAIHLFQEGVISVGRAAELAGIARSPFELMLGEMRIPSMCYGMEEYRQDLQTIERLFPSA